jgi:hypothetical protein
VPHLHEVLTAAEPWLREYGYPALAVAVGLEGFEPPAPGQTLLIGAAILADQGRLNIALGLATVWLAAVARDNIGYWDRQAGPAQRALEAPRTAASARSSQSVLLPRLAWPRFLMFNALGCMAWVTVWGWGTYQLGRHDAAFRLRPLGALGSRSTACRRSDGPANAASPSTR